MPISEDRADRIELKLDALTQAVHRLAVIDERQIEAGRRVGHLEDRVAKAETMLSQYKETFAAELVRIEKKVDTWIQRGIGAWALAMTIYTLYTTFFPR